jgi:hypothetical protein
MSRRSGGRNFFWPSRPRKTVGLGEGHNFLMLATSKLPNQPLQLEKRASVIPGILELQLQQMGEKYLPASAITTGALASHVDHGVEQTIEVMAQITCPGRIDSTQEMQPGRSMTRAITVSCQVPDLLQILEVVDIDMTPSVTNPGLNENVQPGDYISSRAASRKTLHWLRTIRPLLQNGMLKSSRNKCSLVWLFANHPMDLGYFSRRNVIQVAVHQIVQRPPHALGLFMRECGVFQ